MFDMTQKTLEELVTVIQSSSNDSEIENAVYEISFRQEMMEVMARGGVRPTHQPPH